jgi:hypothetical protein
MVKNPVKNKLPNIVSFVTSFLLRMSSRAKNSAESKNREAVATEKEAVRGLSTIAIPENPTSVAMMRAFPIFSFKISAAKINVNMGVVKLIRQAMLN